MAHGVRWAIVGFALLGSAALRAGEERPSAPEGLAMDDALRLSLDAKRATSESEPAAPRALGSGRP